MQLFKNLLLMITDDEKFLQGLKAIEGWVSKLLSVGMIIVTFAAIGHLSYSLVETLLTVRDYYDNDGFNKRLFQLFGLFLNVLIALEILENITAYLKKHVIQVELVLVTSLIAVARKIIILDLEKKDSNDLIALGVAALALSVSYLMIRLSNNSAKH
jgi:uncharacterized membrane protein (DUF373 family)